LVQDFIQRNQLPITLDHSNNKDLDLHIFLLAFKLESFYQQMHNQQSIV